MGQSDLSIDKLVKITVEVLLLNNLKTLDNINLSRKSDNIWSQLSYKYFNNYDYKNSLNVANWWKRNVKKYADIIKNIFVDQKIEHKHSFHNNSASKTVILKFNSTEFLSLKSFVGNYERPKFKSEFDDFLSEKIQNLGIKCWLKCKFNWFRNSNKNNLNACWRGVFVCINHPNCLNKFEALMFTNNDLLNNSTTNNFFHIFEKELFTITLNYEQQTVHDTFLKKEIRCTGKKREEQNLEILQHGLTNSQTNNVIFNQMTPSFSTMKVTNRHTLKMIKSEFSNKNKISSDVFTDALAAKAVTDGLCLESNSNIEGYISEIGLYPFGFLLICDIQVI